MRHLRVTNTEGEPAPSSSDVVCEHCGAPLEIALHELQLVCASCKTPLVTEVQP